MAAASAGVGVLASLAGGIGGKFVSKALGHPARAARASGEKQVAATESTKGFGTVSYECVRRIDASVAAGTAHPLYLNLGRAGGKTEVGDEIACFHAAQDLGAQFTGREFDDAAGKPLSVTHPEFYAATNGAVPDNTGSAASRVTGAAIQDAVGNAQISSSPGVMAYDANVTPQTTGGPSAMPSWVKIAAIGGAVLLGAVLLFGGHHG